MNTKKLYTSHNLAISIKNRAKTQNVMIKQLLDECGMGSNAMSALYHGKAIAFDKLAYIADYLNCSVDYILERTDTPTYGSVEGMDGLNADGKELVIEYIKMLSNNDKYRK